MLRVIVCYALYVTVSVLLSDYLFSSRNRLDKPFLESLRQGLLKLYYALFLSLHLFHTARNLFPRALVLGSW